MAASTVDNVIVSVVLSKVEYSEFEEAADPISPEDFLRAFVLQAIDMKQEFFEKGYDQGYSDGVRVGRMGMNHGDRFKKEQKKKPTR